MLLGKVSSAVGPTVLQPLKAYCTPPTCKLYGTVAGSCASVVCLLQTQHLHLTALLFFFCLLTDTLRFTCTSEMLFDVLCLSFQFTAEVCDCGTVLVNKRRQKKNVQCNQQFLLFCFVLFCECRRPTMTILAPATMRAASCATGLQPGGLGGYTSRPSSA